MFFISYTTQVQESSNFCDNRLEREKTLNLRNPVQRGRDVSTITFPPSRDALICLAGDTTQEQRFFDTRHKRCVASRPRHVTLRHDCSVAAAWSDGVTGWLSASGVLSVRFHGVKSTGKPRVSPIIALDEVPPSWQTERPRKCARPQSRRPLGMAGRNLIMPLPRGWTQPRFIGAATHQWFMPLFSPYRSDKLSLSSLADARVRVCVCTCAAVIFTISYRGVEGRD